MSGVDNLPQSSEFFLLVLRIRFAAEARAGGCEAEMRFRTLGERRTASF